ncbi:Uncharacterised protein [BD1-7 clade bacterium]|uniref:HTH cro/C1-type domain-containing protein n=1 Tax=BD1-7 clade bacterium TaxID=2029982 RepID=A0A5S9Q1U0_9GAMM|nr:Uncharacterised protein [BD1-7 clade bacterium]CAA0112315.1 Uncharacterised protein [BD1-7 clade bacterium]
MANEFGQLLRLWRKKLGLSQLALSTAANVSAKHISFLESGKTHPSRDMVEKLATAMQLSASETDKLLLKAGWQARGFCDHEQNQTIETLERIAAYHAPHPGVVSDQDLRPVIINDSMKLLMEHFYIDITDKISVVEWLFCKTGLRPHIENWDETASTMIRMLKNKYRQSRPTPSNVEVLERLLRQQDIHKMWKQTTTQYNDQDAFVPLVIRTGKQLLNWNLVLMTYGTPRQVSLDEYQMEFFYPLDIATENFARDFLSAPAATPSKIAAVSSIHS